MKYVKRNSAGSRQFSAISLKAACALIALLGVCTTTRAAGPADGFPLLDGQRQAVIVGGKSPFLNGAIERCTGKKLTEIREAQFLPATGQFPIYIGETKKAREVLAEEIKTLDDEGYVLYVTPDFAVIYAAPARTNSGQALVWAEGDFARRFMGVDHYIPGPLGEVYPKTDRLLIPCGKWVENPVFKSRAWSGYAGSAGRTWRIRASGGAARFAFHHNFWSIFDPKKYSDHPEYYPELNGQRSIPTKTTYWQPCTSHPDVLRITVETVLAAFDKEGNKFHSFSLGVNDSGGFCQCAKCLAATPDGVEPKSREASAYRFFKFYNAVAAQVAGKYPEARLGFLAYGALSTPPVEALHPILMPYLTQTQADAFDPGYRQRLDDRFAEWGKMTSHLGMYEWLYGDGFMVPRLYSHEMAKGLRHARSCGADGFYAEAYANWGLDGPKLWIVEKLLWNPDENVDALMDTWCQGLFGPAAAPKMRAYFDRLERAWTEQKTEGEKFGGYRLMGSLHKGAQFTQVFPPAVCDEAWALIEAAETAATDESTRARVAYFKSSFGATRLASTRFNAAQNLSAMTKDGVKRTSADWLLALEDWARFPALDQHMAAVRISAPRSFARFCQPDLKPEQPISFAEWDTDSPAIRTIVNTIVAEIMKPAGGVTPVNKAEFDARAAGMLSAATTAATGAGKSCDNAVRVVRPLLRSAALDAIVLSADPVIDGDIEAAWGRPSFANSFFDYPYETQPSALQTQVWLALRDGKLYLAFRCLQDPKSIAGKLAERDALEMIERTGGVKSVNLGKPIPYLATDTVGVLLPGAYVAAVTSAGGIMDVQATPQGIRVDWNGTDAKVKLTEDGWSAELVVTVEPRSPILRGGAVPGFNFFRCTSQPRRSAWVAAAPHKWSYSPGTGGIVFFPAP
ncbi:MAG: DUF4838 domain-containing protein [Verrucomicrobiota bacterium]|nr:DUF4838 domain-containing protein [Verrucomicrobiota bacterium]